MVVNYIFLIIIYLAYTISRIIFGIHLYFNMYNMYMLNEDVIPLTVMKGKFFFSQNIFCIKASLSESLLKKKKKVL